MVSDLVEDGREGLQVVNGVLQSKHVMEEDLAFIEIDIQLKENGL